MAQVLKKQTFLVLVVSVAASASQGGRWLGSLAVIAIHRAGLRNWGPPVHKTDTHDKVKCLNNISKLHIGKLC